MMKINMTDSLFEFRKFVFKDLMKMGYKFIARDKDGAIFAYSRKPIKLERAWFIIPVDDTYQNIPLLSCMFTDIKWEDEEPFKIPYVDIDNFDE